MRAATLARAIAHALSRPAAPHLLTAAVAAGALAPMVAFAQDANPDAKQDKLETIVVTGSRIRRVDLETASPVFVVDKAQIEKTGKLTIGDLLQEAPSIAGAATNPQVNNGGGTGAATIELRGLGSNRTLVLVNGHRLAGPSPDVNQIPVNLIERIEVLKDGASAIYGTDAIGGVVNFILRRDYQGLEASADYGISDRNDGERRGASMSMGHTSDRGSIMIGLNYNKQEQVSAADRKFSKQALYLSTGAVTAGGSTRTATGHIFLTDALAQQFGCADVTRKAGATGSSLSDYRCFNNPGDLFNYQAVGNVLLTPQERASLFVVGTYKLSDGIETYVEAFHNKTISNSAIAPLPFDARSDGITISKNSIYNPFGYDLGAGNADGLNFTTRMLGLGNRTGLNTTTNDQINLGLRGSIGGSSWTWDANYTFSRYSLHTHTLGYLYGPALQAALGPSFVDASGHPTCGTPSAPIAGCVPINIFNITDPATVAALRTVSVNPFAQQYYDQRNFQLNATGEVFELPAGAVSLALGAEYRKEYINSQTDFLTIALPPNYTTCYLAQETCTAEIVGGFNVKEFYAEALIPVLKDAPFAKTLNVTIGSRYSDYSNFGNTTNSKIGVEWRPLDDLLVRGTVAEVFRAPTVTNLFQPPTANAPTFSDPCAGLTQAQLDQIRSTPYGAALCSGVKPNYHPPNGQVTGLFSGNTKLKPEQGKVFTWGMVYDPAWLEGFSSSLDYYRIYLNNTIETLDVNTVARVCQAGDMSFCNLISRFPNGDINVIKQPTSNLGRVDTAGVDIGLKYRLPETSFGNFRVALDTTYIAKYNRDTVTDKVSDPILHNAGTFSRQDGNYARWRALASLSWNLGNWDATWRTRYVHGFELGNQVPCGFSGKPNPPSCESADGTFHDPGVTLKIGAVTYHNVEAGYNFEAINTRIDVGIDNLFDKQPPLLYQNNVINANTDVSTFNTVGRYYWARVGVKF